LESSGFRDTLRDGSCGMCEKYFLLPARFQEGVLAGKRLLTIFKKTGPRQHLTF
jgi:hypothetical protein